MSVLWATWLQADWQIKNGKRTLDDFAGELPGEEPWLHGVWESNINVCTDDDPEICGTKHGGWPLKTAMCKVYKAKSY